MANGPRSGNVWTICSRLLTNAMPIAGPQETANALAVFWCELTGSDAAVVCSTSEEGGPLVAARANRAQSAVPISIEGASAIDFGTTGFFDETSVGVLREHASLGDLRDHESTVVPFSDDQVTLGLSLLFLASGKSQSSEPELSYATELARLSARLVKQSHGLTERDLPGSCSLASRDAESELETAKLEALVEFAAGAGHEINNPLATISGRVQLLLRTETDPQRRQALETIGGQAYRIRDMIGDLMLLGRPPAPNPRLLNLPDEVQSVITNLSGSAQARECILEYEEQASISIWADPAQLSVAISSLVQNAIESMDDGGPIRLSTYVIREPVGSFARLRVVDCGRGLSSLDRKHLFDPFYSGRQAGRGLGFGLSKCWRIVKSHGGRIEYKSTPGGNSTFDVYWPAGPLDNVSEIRATGLADHDT